MIYYLDVICQWWPIGGVKMTKLYIQIDIILTIIQSSNYVLFKNKIYTNLHIYNCSWHFRVHLQYVRHCKWFFAHLQVLHLAVLQLQTATALCRLSSAIEVHCNVKLSFLINHPQLVAEGGVFWDKVFPHIHPLWYALLRQCNVKASCDGGRHLKS